MKKSIIPIVLAILVLAGCRDYEEFQIDPNNTTRANPGLLLTDIEVNAFRSIELNAALASRYVVNVNQVNDFQYYGWDRAGFGFYNTLRQVQKMEEEAMLLDNQNFLAIAKFFRAYIFEQLTRQFGDIPFSNALQAEDAVINPVYDTQKDVYIGILDLLTEANDMIAVTNSEITGDIVFDGDLIKWKKLINSYHLRVLMSLSIKTNDPDLDIAAAFNRIYSDPGRYPIMTSTSDNCQYTFSEETGNTYPFWRSASITTSYIMESGIIDYFKQFNDPRLFVIADPEDLASGMDPFDFNSYRGFNGSDPISINTSKLAAGEGSPLDSRYVEDSEAEPNLAMGFAEVNFTLAEAANRGWIEADAAEFYERGIRASMAYYAIANNQVEAYLQDPAVQYDPEIGLEQILVQKYLSMFFNSGWEPFYNFRRTGIPAFDVSGDGILNQGRVPTRWMYPMSEVNLNQDNLEAAIARQYPEGDNINGLMWSIDPN